MGHPGVQEPWHVQKHFVGTWEVFRLPRCRAGPQRRRRNQDTEMYDLKKSDVAIVAVKPANNGRQRTASLVTELTGESPVGVVLSLTP